MQDFGADQGAEGAYLGHHVFAASFLRRASRARSGCLPLGTRPCPFSAWGGQGSQEPQPKGLSQCCILCFTKCHMPASHHPNPAHFLLGSYAGNGWHVTPCFLDAPLRTCRNEPSSSSVSDPRHWLQHALFTSTDQGAVGDYVRLPLPALCTAVHPAGPVSQTPMPCWRHPAG